MQQKIHKITQNGLLLAVCLVLSFIESLLPSFSIPGVRLGLANVVIMYACFFINFKTGISLSILKGVFIFFTRGIIASLLSLSGGLLSILIIFLLKKVKCSVIFISVIAAIFHNIGQILMASFILYNSYALYYLPFLLLSGVVMGCLTGYIFKFLTPIINKCKNKFTKGEDFIDENL